MKFSILAQAILALPALATAIPEPVDTTEGKSYSTFNSKAVEY